MILGFLFFSTLLLSQEHDKSLGEIHGKITITSQDELAEEIMHGRMMSRYGSDPSMSSKPIPPYKLSEKAVLYIDSVAGGRSYDPPDVHPQMNQRDLIFRPLVLPVVVGTTIDFPNNDNVFHNVFSYSQSKEFDLGRYAQGKSKSITFEKQGVVNVYCEIHQYMYATILVLANPFFALPDDDGLFVIRDIPPGTYHLSFWYGRKKVDARTVTVKENEVSAVNFSY